MQTEAYNDQVVLDGTHTGQLQVGTDNGQNITFNIKSIDTDAIGLTGASTDAATEATNAAQAELRPWLELPRLHARAGYYNCGQRHIFR